MTQAITAGLDAIRSLGSGDGNASYDILEEAGLLDLADLEGDLPEITAYTGVSDDDYLTGHLRRTNANTDAIRQNIEALNIRESSVDVRPLVQIGEVILQQNII